MYCFFKKENFDHYLTFLLYIYTCIYENNERSGKSKNFQKIKKLLKYLKVKNTQNTLIYLLEVDIHLHSKDWENGKQGRINLLNASNI